MIGIVQYRNVYERRDPVKFVISQQLKSERPKTARDAVPSCP